MAPIVQGGYQQLTLVITLISYVLLFVVFPSRSFQITNLLFFYCHYRWLQHLRTI